MPHLNKVFLMGNLTRDPELRYTKAGKAVVDMRIAVNGRAEDKPLFVKCVAWNKTAETAAEYLHKGDPVFIEGILQLEEWKDGDGNDRQEMKVVVFNMQFLKGKAGGGEHRAARQARPEPEEAPAEAGGDEEAPF